MPLCTGVATSLRMPLLHGHINLLRHLETATPPFRIMSSIKGDKYWNQYIVHNGREPSGAKQFQQFLPNKANLTRLTMEEATATFNCNRGRGMVKARTKKKKTKGHKKNGATNTRKRSKSHAKERRAHSDETDKHHEHVRSNAISPPGSPVLKSNKTKKTRKKRSNSDDKSRSNSSKSKAARPPKASARKRTKSQSPPRPRRKMKKSRSAVKTPSDSLND